MSSHDPSTWVSCAATGALLLAMLPWQVTPERGLHWAGGWPAFLLLLGAIALTVANWYAGSRWIIWFSYLGEPEATMPSEPWNAPAISAPSGVPVGVWGMPYLLVLVVLIVRGCT